MQFNLRTLFVLSAAVAALIVLWRQNAEMGIFALTLTGSLSGILVTHQYSARAPSPERRWGTALFGALFGGLVTAAAVTGADFFARAWRTQLPWKVEELIFILIVGAVYGLGVGAVATLTAAGAMKFVRWRQSLCRRPARGA